MVTYGFCQAGPRVRFPAPHPFFVLLAVLLLSGSAFAADQQTSLDVDHYAAAPQTLASSLSSGDSLARVVGGDIFGIYWSSFGGNGQITAIDGVSMRDRADGVQELATATYKTFQGVESEIDSVRAAVGGNDIWLEQIFDLLRSSTTSGNATTYTSIADLTADLLARNTDRALSFAGTNLTGATISNLLALISRNQYDIGGASAFLNSLGVYVSGGTYRSLGFITGSGFAGLAKLLSGRGSDPILGLAASGLDKEGVRGSWSLSDISANGFSGLATLLSGSNAHRGNWVYLNQSGFEGNGSTSLMDMVGEGFLGLGSLISDTTPGSGSRLTWDYLSYNDGVSSTQLQHDTLFGFLGSFGSAVQNPLARLAYVLADPDDVQFKQDEKPNMDAVKDSFFGDGAGSVVPDQIKDAAGISSAAKDAFKSDVSAGDAFTAISDPDSYWFFTQPVADALDTVNTPAVVSDGDDELLDQFVLGDDGFYEPDLSPWSLFDYLGG